MPLTARTQLERLWLIGAGIIAFALVAIGYFFFVSPQRSDTSSVDGQVSTARLQNDVCRTRISHLAVQNKDIAKYQADAARGPVWRCRQRPEFRTSCRTLQAIGSSTGSDVATLTVGDPTPIGPAPSTKADQHGQWKRGRTCRPCRYRCGAGDVGIWSVLDVHLGHRSPAQRRPLGRSSSNCSRFSPCRAHQPDHPERRQHGKRRSWLRQLPRDRHLADLDAGLRRPEQRAVRSD